ncbi:uncharacterized protein LOC127787469 [Diospyros lotus]|uniref:uncharacterized protein LOC127787469 n=1 Tax=Diospyros lotus TaxID=55363 RepID=UPI0022553CD4|nr:uncharacterized protein LOC127787469 [Diospyros lotus]
MAFYADEEEVWKCPQHPSKRRKTGICPTCLRDRLNTLCPDCANVRPCACCPTSATTSSNSSSSSSFSLFSSRSVRESSRAAGVGSVGRVSNLIESEPSFHRSRSVGLPFLRSRLASVRDYGGSKTPAPGTQSRSSFWSVFRTRKNKKGAEEEDEESKRPEYYVQRMMMRSRSVSVPAASNRVAGDVRASPGKNRGWYFPSPIKAFRHWTTPRVVRERSPLYRG